LKQDAPDVPAQAQVTVNDHAVVGLNLPPPDQPAGPVELDISHFIVPGGNQVQIRQAGSSATASVELIATHYEPWDGARGTKQDKELHPAALGDSSGLRLAVNFSSTNGPVDGEITCHVAAERVGFRGYGMMLAEIGLPPGVEVDRESLERAAQNFRTGVGRYDVLPDRVVFYLWPQAGGSNFDFTVQPRLGEKARTGPSVLYDYYNPEASAVAPPTVFTIH
jgi:hypothetical protein